MSGIVKITLIAYVSFLLHIKVVDLPTNVILHKVNFSTFKLWL